MADFCTFVSKQTRMQFPEPSVLVLLVLGGFAGGMLGGTLGVGGAVVVVPVITHYLQQWGFADELLVKATLANSLCAVLFAGISATWRQYKSGNLFPRQSLATAFPGIVTTLTVAWLISLSGWYTHKRFSAFFLCVLGLLAYRMFSKAASDATAHPQTLSLRKFSLVGGIAGIITALSGLGGGVIMVPAFNQFLKIDIRKSIALSTAVIPFFALPNILWYLWHTPPVYPAAGPVHWGYVVPGMMLPMIAGVMAGAPLGVRTGQRLPMATLRALFVGMMLIVGGKMLFEMIQG